MYKTEKFRKSDSDPSQGLRQASFRKGKLVSFLHPKRVRFFIYFIVPLFFFLLSFARHVGLYARRDSKIYLRKIFINRVFEEKRE